MSIINSSSRFVLEKMGLSAEWYYLSQQRLTTKHFILLGCYQLGGNFISWKEEQFGRAAAVLSRGVCVSQHEVVPGSHREEGAVLTGQSTPRTPQNSCSHPVAASRASLCEQGEALTSKAGRAQRGLSWTWSAPVLLPCCWRCSGDMAMYHLRTWVSGRQCGGAEFMAGLGDLRVPFQPHQFCDSMGKIHRTEIVRITLLLYNF